ncbi:acyl-CoA dehydrogenase [Photorhabdus tasmaniensis]|uniref:Acyl-CoA dehydrogenase n=1 Tax=Photorhabdus tasmaniensis TaxID=1004159 RepID=A0ABX0GKL6_9GAMM|nr:acyl-CoA dehydrogenase [Photorhabdus tasmaniensis]NHB88920.1 acyl-CoA dehydrogenase [Photorhabdus tasmaniensis]
MTDIVEELRKNSGKYQHLTPDRLKRLLLDSEAASQCLRLVAQSSIEGLNQVGKTVREVSSWLPAVGIALTMHNHIVLACSKFPDLFEDNNTLLNEVMASKALVASAFAEGLPGANIFMPSLKMHSKGGKLLVNGSKKPCSLSSIADYYVLSVCDTDNGNEMRVVLVSKSAQSIKVIPFWRLGIFTESDNQEVKFSDTEISSKRLSHYKGFEQQSILSYGLSLFNYFAANTYSGVLSGLARFIPEKVAEQQSIKYTLTQADYKINVILDQMLTIAFYASQDENAVYKILALRYTLEKILEEAANFIFRCCGGIKVMTTPEIMSFYSAVQLFKFHPVGEFQMINQIMQPA